MLLILDVVFGPFVYGNVSRQSKAKFQNNVDRLGFKMYFVWKTNESADKDGIFGKRLQTVDTKNQSNYSKTYIK